MKGKITLKVYIPCLKSDRRVSMWSNSGLFQKEKKYLQNFFDTVLYLSLTVFFLRLLGNKQQAIFLVQHLDLFPVSLKFILFSLSLPSPLPLGMSASVPSIHMDMYTHNLILQIIPDTVFAWILVKFPVSACIS